MRIVFMGTPEFAVSILEAIHRSENEIVGVVTATDKPAGRGRKLRASAVKNYAEKEALPLLQPAKLKDPGFLKELKSLEADLFIVVAFRMLPKEVWQMPAKGTINLHASLLPQYRGAAPINWVIVNGESQTGLSTFFINENIDTGDILMQSTLAIGPNETAGELHDRMMFLGADLIVKTIQKINTAEYQLIEQSHIPDSDIKYAPKIFKEDTRIDWKQKPQNIHNLIRGMSPFPGAWTLVELKGETFQLKIYRSKIVEAQSPQSAGSLYCVGKRLFVALKDAHLELLEIQIEGKKRMKALDFLNGQEIHENDKIL